MNPTRIVLATLGGFVTYFVLGGAAFGAFPALKNEFLKYPQIYRNQQGQMSALPAGMVAMFVSMLALAVIYAMVYRAGSGWVQGARFGALIGVFSVGAFVVHNYVNLNIGLKGTAQQAVAYFVEWTLTGIAMGLIYRPAR